MQEKESKISTVAQEKPEEKKVQVIDTDKNERNGQDKCPKCGSTDISFDMKRGCLYCNYCRYEFPMEQLEEIEDDIEKIEGTVLTSGLEKIRADASNLVTLKCSSCGAEITIDTEEVSQVRCHWCRNILSLNEQVANGSVPDVILPFKVTKEEAKEEMYKFVQKRKSYANEKFKKEFALDNIMGVYLPYVIVDVNAHGVYYGEAEISAGKYIGQPESEEGIQLFYKADSYMVTRNFDIRISNLTLESKKETLNYDDSDKTINIINAIMPFDTENCVKYNANYLKGFTIEKRNLDFDDLDSKIDQQAKLVARFALNSSVSQYNRGVHWKSEKLEVTGKQWVAAYLPVWIYSYQEKIGEKKILHYVVVNGRTKETMGSIPLNRNKLFLITFLLEFISFALMCIIIIYTPWDFLGILLLASGVSYYTSVAAKNRRYDDKIYAQYRNRDQRHYYENETNVKIENMEQKDLFLKRKDKLDTPMIRDCNNQTESNKKKSRFI